MRAAAAGLAASFAARRAMPAAILPRPEVYRRIAASVARSGREVGAIAVGSVSPASSVRSDSGAAT
jgi:hypothetical protein